MGLDRTRCAAYNEVFEAEKYGLMLLDMDGTLYYQRKMQFYMCLEMLGFALCHPASLWKLRTISVFRKIREEAGDEQMLTQKDFTEKQDTAQRNHLQKYYEKTADKIRITPEEVKKVIEEWMFKRPLKYIYKCRDSFLCTKVVEWQNKGIKVVVYSDYPAEEKCKALGLTLDGVYSSEQEKIGDMKPSSKAVEVIAADFGMKKGRILTIGDRYSKDGKMAENAGVDYLILEKWYVKRKKKWN